MAQDDELVAISLIAETLNKLDDASRLRVLRWAADKFGLSSGLKMANLSMAAPVITGDDAMDLATIYAAAAPKTDAEKALVVAYWTATKGEKDFSSQAINAELKQLGHGVTNITSALSTLMAAKPQLVIQVQKSGKSQQARKKYRLTVEGTTRVQKMVNEDHEGP